MHTCWFPGHLQRVLSVRPSEVAKVHTVYRDGPALKSSLRIDNKGKSAQYSVVLSKLNDTPLCELTLYTESALFLPPIGLICQPLTISNFGSLTTYSF